ncbi:MAG: hypothetical protein II739_04330, partial [Clostridia bacterium]|nr:hypothetical protein [Clostridia bacterium]
VQRRTPRARNLLHSAHLPNEPKPAPKAATKIIPIPGTGLKAKTLAMILAWFFLYNTTKQTVSDTFFACEAIFALFVPSSHLQPAAGKKSGRPCLTRSGLPSLILVLNKLSVAIDSPC